MHLIERYALSTGLKIDNPQISHLFFPVACEKYVCFHASAKDNLRDYDYWLEVKSLLKKYFEKNNFKTVQIGLEKDPSLKCDIDLRGKTNIRQMAYVVKKCDLFLGVDSFPAHLAGFYNRKMLSIYSNSFAACVRPYWGNQNNQKIIETDRPNGEKPSFSFQENPKTINRIKPEKIAQSALDVLGIKQNIKHKTLFIGDRYKERLVHVIPDYKYSLPKANIVLRLDLLHNEENCYHLLRDNNISISIFTNKPLNDITLKSKNINNIAYFSDEFNEEFVNRTKKHGITIRLVCTKKENLSEQRLKFFDDQIILIEEKEKIKNNKKKISLKKVNFKIRSYSIYMKNGEAYHSLFEANEKNNLDDIFVDLDKLMIYTD
jgi:hypothetical protein